MQSSSINIFTDTTVANLCKIWGIKNKSISNIEKKITDRTSVISRFLTLPNDIKDIIYHLLFSFGDGNYASTRSIIQKCNIKFKKNSENSFDTSYIENSGFVYIQKKRAKLNAIDDTITLLPQIAIILKDIFLNSENDLKLIRHNKNYDKKVYLKFYEDIKIIYSLGLSFNIEDIVYSSNTFISKEFEIYKDTVIYSEKIDYIISNIDLLLKADILSLFFIKIDGNIKSYISISNDKVVEDIEKSLNTIKKPIHYKSNHKNIFYDIDMFIDRLLMGKIKISRDGSINKKHINTINSEIFTDKVDYKYIYNICLILDIIKEDNIDKERYKYIKGLQLKERVNYLFGYIFLSNNYISILNIIDGDEYKNGMSIYKLLNIINSANNNKISMTDIQNTIINLYIFGNIFINETDDNIYISLSNNVEEKFITTGTFDFMFINHQSFSDKFIYLCMLFSEIKKQDDNIYEMTITEESISNGKTLSLHNTNYTFEDFIAMLVDMLDRYGYKFAMHTESTLRRWYNKSYFAMICDSAVIIKINNTDKIDEILHSAKRLHINIKKISETYLLISNDTVSKSKIMKFFSANKINIDFVDFDDIL